jgi:hypothetical protein
MSWRLSDADHTIAYAPAAQIHHHRRDSIHRFLGQQRGYGRAERLLADVHRHRFNRLGQARWSGTIYGMTPLLPRLIRPVVYTGWHGQAPYQTVQRRRADAAAAVGTAFVPSVAALALAAVLVSPFILPALFVFGAAMAALAIFFVAMFASVQPRHDEAWPRRYRATVAWLHIAQPLARTWGLLRTRSERISLHDVDWVADRTRWVGELIRALGRRGIRTVVGPDGEHWDIRARWGPLTVADLNVAVVWGWEARARYRLRPTRLAILATVLAILVTIWLGSLLAAGVTGVIVMATIGSLIMLRYQIRAAVAETAPHASTVTPRSGRSL